MDTVIHFNEEAALAKLLTDGVLFCGEGMSNSIAPAVILLVGCNDTFCRAADAEPLPLDEIENLYRMHIADPKWGSTKWCCRRILLQPMKDVVEHMKKDDAWEEWMDKLVENKIT